MNSDLNVLMFGWELPPHNSGGMGVACYGLTKGLSQTGANITFVLPKKLPVNAEFMHVKFDELQGVKEIAVNSLLHAYMNAYGYKKLLYEGEYIDARIFGETLYDEALRFGSQAGKWAAHVPHGVIHVHDWMTFPAGMEAARISGKPWIAHVHATEYDRAGDDVDTRIAQIEYEGLHKADRVVCVSDFTRRKVHQKYGVGMNKMVVIHNGVEDASYSKLDTEKLLPGMDVVLFVGRLTMQKGAEYFLKAATRVLEVRPDTVFVLAGSGDLEKKLLIMASSLGIADKVIFPGFMRGKKLASLYQRADVFVMPSVSEPFGLVGLEALAHQRPVILSRQSGVSEVISHALKADFWDIDRLADQIISVLEYPEMAEMLAKRGHEEMKGVTWNRAAERTVSLYRELLA